MDTEVSKKKEVEYKTELEDGKPLWLQEFDTGLAEGWREDDRLLYAECTHCTRAVWSPNDGEKLAWVHYNPPEFHLPQYPRPCFTPDPKPETVIGEVKKKQEEPENIFTKKMDAPPKSAEMLLFMMSTQDRFLFGEMFKRLKKTMTPGEISLCHRMLISMKAHHVINEGMEEDMGKKNDPEGVENRENLYDIVERTDNKEDNIKDKNPEGIPADGGSDDAPQIPEDN